MSDNVDKLHAHTVALEQNQEQLRQRIAMLEAKLHAAQVELGASIMREAELQTQVNVLKERLAHEIVGDLNDIDRILAETD